MRCALIAALLGALFGCNPVFAQQMVSPIPGLEATSPLGMVPGSPVAPIGIPLGSTELASPGLSPPPTGTTTPPQYGGGRPKCKSARPGTAGSVVGKLPAPKLCHFDRRNPLI